MSPGSPKTAIVPPIWFFLTLISMIALHLVFPVRRLLSSPWLIAGVVVLAVGVALALWAANLFGRAGTAV